MSPSLRFLGWSVTMWVAVRAASFGLFPESEALAQVAPPPRLAQSTPAPPLPPIDRAFFVEDEAPVIASPPTPVPLAWAPDSRRHGAMAPRLLALTAAVSLEPPLAPPHDAQSDLRLSPVRPLDRWPVDALLRGRAPDRRLPGSPGTALQIPRDERLRLSAWAMMRGPATGSSLANGGVLGGSQGGARMLYRLRPRLDASIRVSAPLSSTTRGAELAAGLHYQPLASIPVALTIERRQAFGRGGGRSDFALFAEGGVWQRPLPAGFRLDGYAQAGVVGMSKPAAFADGAATATRPLWRGISGGLGLWGGIQPGASRLDLGPRLTWRLLPNTRVAVDYRLKAAGNAVPGSGPVMTLSGDF